MVFVRVFMTFMGFRMVLCLGEVKWRGTALGNGPPQHLSSLPSPVLFLDSKHGRRPAPGPHLIVLDLLGSPENATRSA